jgi:hypothetical protein
VTVLVVIDDSAIRRKLAVVLIGRAVNIGGLG